VAQRINLGQPDTRIALTDEAVEAVACEIRKHRPRLLISHYDTDVHPDHEATCRLARRAAFIAGLRTVRPELPPHRPRHVLSYMSHHLLQPSLCVDISKLFERKLEAVRAFVSQWQGDDTSHFHQGQDPLQRLITRNRYFGSLIGVDYAEPFVTLGPVPINSLRDLA
jgi:LmbE family N-acetylglucosaminyl deacetylase